jgi:tetratricopeptide (TPR) repeat protein
VRRGRALTGLAGLALLAAGCGGRNRYVPAPGPYDLVPEEWSETLFEARAAVGAGRFREAHDLVRPLALRRPELLPVRVFLQELQLDLLQIGEPVGGFEVPEPADAVAWLGDTYRVQADRNPMPATYVLAARLALGGDEALALLEQAGELDAGCVWVHYGRAWWSARLRRFPEAREGVAAAFALDAGHGPTMRLHASLLAGAGEIEDAIECLVLWLERGEPDPLVDPSLRAEALVDLAALHLLAGRPGVALSHLTTAVPEDIVHPARAELVRAVALEDLGQRSLALAAARRAKQLAPDDLLPMVHQALLLQFEGNVNQERNMWELLLAEVEERADEEDSPAPTDDPTGLDLATLLIQLQARARLGQIERENPRPRGARGAP